tara:strand:+ start:2005 stop:2700 length:696 start_codon:yes stop_codon:yes gene_type:complete
MISLVTTYKNRRHHIEKTLPTWLNQTESDYEVIILDYDSDDDLHGFLSSLNSKVKVKHIKCPNKPLFVLSHARNVGANEVDQDWILFIDIDTCLYENSIHYLMQIIKDSNNNYFAATGSEIRKEIINGGLILVKKTSHCNMMGFNEDIKGWGYEDIDYKKRLEQRGEKFEIIDEHYYRCIDHSDEERTQCWTENKEISWTKNRQIALKRWSSSSYGKCDEKEITIYESGLK